MSDNISPVYGMFAAITGLLAVLLGAFGTHVLEDELSVDRFDTLKTAIRYQMYHSIVMIIIAFAAQNPNQNNSLYLKRSLVAFMFGILFFSGSLYLLILTDVSILGAITPIGGLLFIVGWIFLFNSFKK